MQDEELVKKLRTQILEINKLIDELSKRNVEITIYIGEVKRVGSCNCPILTIKANKEL